MTTPQPLPRHTRFERMGLGLFLHFGLYSVSSVGEWTMKHHALDKERYRKRMQDFTADQFSGDTIGQFCKDVGFKYCVLGTRHHDGFSLYDTRGLNEYDAPHSAAGRDLVADYVEGLRKHDIVPFFYHTTGDWTWDTDNRDQAAFNEYLDYLHASVEILCKHYGEIGGFWFDGNWMRDDIDWNEDRLYSIIRQHQPDTMIINNTSLGRLGELGHPEVDSVTFEQGQPQPMNRNGMAKYLCAEMCQTTNLHWGIATRDWFYKSPKDVIEDLLSCRKVGANLLFNIGPEASGKLPDYDQITLKRVGNWIKLYPDLIYETKPFVAKTPGRDFVLQSTKDPKRLYYIALDVITRKNEHETVRLGGYDGLRAIQLNDLTDENTEVQSMQWMDSYAQADFAYDPKIKALTVDVPGFDYGENHIAQIASINLK